MNKKMNKKNNNYVANEVVMRWHNKSSATINVTLQLLDILVANSCDALGCFKSNVNMFRFKHFSNFNY